MNFISALFAGWSNSSIESDDISQSSSIDVPLRLLALGASLTKGYMKHGQDYYPYTEKLAQLLKARHFDPHIDNEGYDGFQTHQLAPILLEALDHHAYDVVAILAGTNDLAQTNDDGEFLHTPRDIRRNLQAMYEAVLNSSADAKLIVLTIPCLFRPKNYIRRSLDSRRDAVNDWIRSYVAEHSDRVFLLDVHDFMDPTNRVLWDDNIHFTRKGYDMIGEEMARLLLGMHLNGEG
jgi:lysophospholipase L1-like esterase